MKMKYRLWVKETGKADILEAKNEAAAFKLAIDKYGPTGFSGLKRCFDNENSIEHENHFLQRAIRNPIKHIHSKNRRGFK